MILTDRSLLGYTDIGKRAFGSWASGFINVLYVINFFLYCYIHWRLRLKTARWTGIRRGLMIDSVLNCLHSGKYTEITTKKILMLVSLWLCCLGIRSRSFSLRFRVTHSKHLDLLCTSIPLHQVYYTTITTLQLPNHDSPSQSL